MKESNIIIRQGDILLERVAVDGSNLPSTYSVLEAKNNRAVVGHGEVTGHMHVVVGVVDWLVQAVEDINTFPVDGASTADVFVRVKTEAKIVHEEHSTLNMVAGLWKITRQREYTPEGVRAVWD